MKQHLLLMNAILFAVLLPEHAFAQSNAIPDDIRALTKNADAILIGTVNTVYSDWSKDYRRIFTFAHIHPAQRFKVRTRLRNRAVNQWTAWTK